MFLITFQESDDLLGMGRYSAAPTPPPVGPRLGERGRSDWRRISVPERGKDFKSLPRKYNRYPKSHHQLQLTLNWLDSSPCMTQVSMGFDQVYHEK